LRIKEQETHLTLLVHDDDDDDDDDYYYYYYYFTCNKNSADLTILLPQHFSRLSTPQNWNIDHTV
jgi:hypothetical protein